MDWNKIEQHINDNFKEIKPDDEHLIIIPDLPLFLIKTSPNEPTYTVFPISPAGQILGGMRFPTKERVVEFMLETSKRALSMELLFQREVALLESIAKSLRAPTKRSPKEEWHRKHLGGFGFEFSNGFNFDELPSNEEMREKINQAKLDKQNILDRIPEQFKSEEIIEEIHSLKPQKQICEECRNAQIETNSEVEKRWIKRVGELEDQLEKEKEFSEETEKKADEFGKTIDRLEEHIENLTEFSNVEEWQSERSILQKKINKLTQKNERLENALDSFDENC